MAQGEHSVVIVEGCFMGTVPADCGIWVISTSVFRTAGLDSHAIIFNKEGLLDVYLPLTWIVFHNYKIDKQQQCDMVNVHMIGLKFCFYFWALGPC